MSCLSEHTRHTRQVGFTLIESMTAAALLVFIGASVWIVLDRCMVSAADATQRVRAFEIARENMEKLIGTDTVQETTEYGASEKFPDIRWQSTIESFYDAQSTGMWVRAVSRAEYTDTAGETKAVEFTHWLTALSPEQAQQLMERREKQQQELAKHIIETEELAAQYAGVNVETIREWVKNGMPTPDGAYIKPWLDLYLSTDGKPTPAEKQEVISLYPELGMPGQSATRPSGETTETKEPGKTGPDTEKDSDAENGQPMPMPPPPPGG
jgi:type II secretory pathway pseudopilin PulG